MDPGSLINGAKNNLDAAIAIIKLYKNTKDTIDGIEHESKFLELKSNILDAKDNILELRAALQEKEEEIQKLTEELKIQKEMEFEDPFYWRIVGTEKNGPFCQKCYDAEKKVVRLRDTGVNQKGAWVCTVCQTTHYTKKYSKYKQEQQKKRNQRTVYRTPFRDDF